MAQRNDQVFQLSLTEIAFTITFILLLLLGYLVFKEQSARKAAEEALAKTKNTIEASATLENVKSTIVQALSGAGASNPDEVITKLVEAEDVRSERDRLRVQLKELDTKLTALTELQAVLSKVKVGNTLDAATVEVESALALQSMVKEAIDEDAESDVKKVSSAAADAKPANSVESGKSTKDSDAASGGRSAEEMRQWLERAISVHGELKKQLKEQLNRELPNEHERDVITDVISTAKRYDELSANNVNPAVVTKENADLRGQVAYLKNRLEARGGRDFPPCWADEATGKVQYLFSVETHPDAVVIKPAWLPARDADAHLLPGIDEIIGHERHSYADFSARVQGIFDRSKELQCRHYVQLKSAISDAVQSDRARLTVENYFYKSEVRR